MRCSLGLVVCFAALSAFAVCGHSFARGDGGSGSSVSCQESDHINDKVIDCGGVTLTCSTYFAGITWGVNSVRCPNTTITTPGHEKCNGVSTEYEDCMKNAIVLQQTIQGKEAECESSSGLEISIGGIKMTIGWWKAVCKNNGPARMNNFFSDLPLTSCNE